MPVNKLKKNVAQAVIKYISFDFILGIGSGSTILYFINFLSKFKKNIIGVVSSSYSTTIVLKKYGINVLDLNTISLPILYIDSADEVNFHMQMIKGGGAALTNEKILASMSKKFICIIDESKFVNKLGKFPLPIEIIPNAYSYIFSEIIKIGGRPKYRDGIITDHGNIIIDVHGLNLDDSIYMENYINSIPGVVTVGLFSKRKADVVLIGTNKGIQILQ